MTVDVEAGGALATAVLAAGEIEKGKQGPRHGKNRPSNCGNCKARLVGIYCHGCGQAAHVHRSLWHMLEESLHGILHFDTKTWRTLPLLAVRPGLLTKRYIEGQRVRYVSPLALFLFTTFLMFFAFSMVRSPGNDYASMSKSERAEARAGLLNQIEVTKKEVTKQMAALDKATTKPKREEIAEELAEATKEQQDAEAALLTFDTMLTALAKGDAASVAKRDKSADGKVDAAADMVTDNPQFGAALKKARENPELRNYKLKNTAYKFSFMLIPISLPFLWLMFFWRPGITMYDHAVFSLYSLSFMSLLFTLIVGVSAIPLLKGNEQYLLFVPPLHMFLQLRETYSLGFFATLWRTAMLLVTAGIVFLIFIVLVGAIATS